MSVLDTTPAPAPTVAVEEPTTKKGVKAVGIASWRLGAGRAQQSDAVQAGAGVRLHAKPGDHLRAGDPLLTLYTDTPDRFARARSALEGAWSISDETVEPTPLVLDRFA